MQVPKPLLVVAVLFLINWTRCDPQEEERAILTQLYHSTNGQYWLRSDNWLSTNVSACYWAGIGCINSRVVQLNLPSNQLTGTLPESIGNLLMLDLINLEGNHLSGTIPESIKNLSMLQRLWLGGNQLSGTIPTWINNLTNLFYLFLPSNQFTGTIPDFSGLPRLQHLYLNTNQLEGTIPASLAANTYLDTIFLAGNKLTGSIPAELGTLTKLQQLLLGRNELSGTIPESIYQITSLGIFSISHNKISGTISNKIRQFQNILAFDFAYNQLSGTIPESIGELKTLVRFEALSNNLTGTIPKSVTQLTTTLTQFLIADNQLTGTIPNDIGNMVGLTHFLASRNRLSGTLPNSITNLHNLLWLQVENNELTGTIPNDIGQLTQLQQLLLSFNRFSGTIPESIGQLTALQSFHAYANQLEGPIPNTIGNLQQLQIVNIVFNNLTGTLPQSIGGMASLTTFAVAHNRISGVIPESFGSLPSIVSLIMNNNNLIGTIPRALGRNRRLTDLTLGANRLSGPLPSFESPGFLPSGLGYFTANDNQLTGTVPITYGLLNRLRTVDLSNNQLTGSVLHLFDLTNTIAELYLSDNKFIGTIPPGLTTRGLLRILKIDNNRFSGTIPESFGQLSSLNYVQIDNNAFSGTLPSTLSRLFRLQELHMANNDLAGTIPVELFELPLAELDLSNNNLNGTIGHGITSMQNLRKLNISSNWFTGTLPAMNNMRTLQQLHIQDNLFRGCLALPSTFKSEASQCNIDGNAFCCSTEEFKCYDSYCPAKSTLYVHSGTTLRLSDIHNLVAFHNLIVEPNATLVVRNKDTLVIDCMQFEGEIVFDMAESEVETPVFYITTTCGGSNFDSMMKISSEGRTCHSPSIRSVSKTITFTLSCPQDKTSIALVVGLTVPLGILLIAAMILLIVTMSARRKREDQLKSRVEMLTLSASHVKNNSAPPEEFKFKLPDDLPIKLSKTSFKFGTKGDLLIVDHPVRDSFTVSLRKSKVISVGSLYDKLVQHRTVVQIRPIISPKYDLIATPQVFEVPDGGSTEVELVLTMKMTTKCQVSFWIELPEEEIYSLIEFDAASEHSPWIDVDEVQVEGDAIGEGGFGAVYKAMYRGQRVAFKTLKMQDLGEEITREFEQEVRMMMNLHHKSIVQFIGASRVTGKRAILTEFITNGDLKHLLQKQQLDMKFKLKLALDIAEALKFLHLNNILHRDIKPENALVVSTSKDAIVNVKLADFGTARSVSDSVTSKFTKGVGTPIFMAVEILKNENYARSADIFSFGVLLWAIITQDEPYKEFKYSWDVAEFVLQGKRMAVPQDCPHQISKLISQCWAQEPNDRPLIGEVVKTIETVYLSTK